MRRLSLIILSTVIFTLVTMCCKTKNYKEKLASLYNHTVPLISSEELKQNLDQGEPIVILDIRSREEYEVSHLANAIFIDYEDFKRSDVRDIPKDSEIISSMISR